MTSIVGVWSFEPLSAKIKSVKCLVLSNPRKFCTSKITRYIRYNYVMLCRPVGMHLDLDTNMRLLGKRFPYLATYQVTTP